jgi:hypothetical protein
MAQNSLAEFEKLLREKVAFVEADFAALKQGQTVVKVFPGQDKGDVAVCGIVGLEVPAEVFLESFRESMVRKTNPAILEIGRFSSPPALHDLDKLTIENRDIEDMKECLVGDCRLKLSTTMIERFHKEMDWETPDYRNRASQLLKLMLLDYVRDYMSRGDAALLEYSDKSKAVRPLDEQRALMVGASYANVQDLKGSPRPELTIVENAIVWSKIKFGLKPVVAINHIIIYKRKQKTGPQILISSKQIYANHYFDSSLALTGFVNIPGASPGSYLFYENRSRADGLGGVFGKIKRRIVEDKVLAGVKAILEQSKVNLNARALKPTEAVAIPNEEPSWRRWTLGGVHLCLWLFLITAFVAMWMLGNLNISFKMPWGGQKKVTAGQRRAKASAPPLVLGVTKSKP